MKNVVIFGAGDLGQMLYSRIKGIQNVLFFVDNNYFEYSHHQYQVLPPSALKENDYDMVYIAAAAGLQTIYEQLVNDLRVPANKINRLYGEFWRTDKNIREFDGRATRIKSLEMFAIYAYDHNIEGNVAEVGVHRGSFAREINRVFPNRKLYLFDTFDGFDMRDLKADPAANLNISKLDELLRQKNNSFRNTSIDDVLGNLPNPEQCVLKQGYFPETFDIAGEEFAFVSLDTDLYKPILSALEIFYPLLSRGGVMFVHDYFGALSGVTNAVDEFTASSNATVIPIADYCSIAVIKN